MVPRVRWGFLLLAVAAVLAHGCQPVDEELAVGENEFESGSDGGEEPAAVDDLAGLSEVAGAVAQEWDAGATLVEVSVSLDDEHGWQEATATFMAPDADRMLVVSVTEDGTTEQDPTLETLGFAAVPGDALEEVPALPDEAAEPGAAAEKASEPLTDCGVGADGLTVRYTSGAPGAWDGSAWSTVPSWSVSVHGEGGGVRLGVEGAVGEDPCFEVP